MKLSISETANLTGVSVRTLRYYDEIGLLKPAEISVSGYRYYDGNAIEQLWQILFYRELGFPLKEISQMLSDPDYDKAAALRNQRELLILKKRQIDSLLELMDKTIGDEAMKKVRTTAKDIEIAKAKYSAEAAEKWGKTDAYVESRKRHTSYSSEQELNIAHEADDIFAAFAGYMDADPADGKVQSLVKAWQDHITAHHYPCSKDILACLGQMYVADERFTENIDRFGDGTARFISEAIAIYCKNPD